MPGQRWNFPNAALPLRQNTTGVAVEIRSVLHGHHLDPDPPVGNGAPARRTMDERALGVAFVPWKVRWRFYLGYLVFISSSNM